MSRTLTFVTGVFAVVVGLLLRSAVGDQDQTDWNGVVRGMLEVLPLLLIAAGVIVIVAAFALSSKTAVDDEDSAAVEPAAPESTRLRSGKRAG